MKPSISRPPAPLPHGPSIHRHSSMRHLSSSQGHMSDMLAEAKKRFTPPPTFAKSSINSASNLLTYGNQFKQINPLEANSGDKVIVYYTFFYFSFISYYFCLLLCFHFHYLIRNHVYSFD